MEIQLIPAYDHPQEISTLFSEYTDMLIAGDSEFQKYLDIQHYEEECEHLEDKYGLPDGRLYLAYHDGELAGCIGFRKIDEENCEMKRLYVRPQFRGKHIGDQLVQKIIKDAKETGYSYMLLDTLPFLKSAIYLYRKYGFFEIERYNDSPMAHSIYMKLNLKKAPFIIDEIPDERNAAPIRYPSEVVRRLYGILAVTLYTTFQKDSRQPLSAEESRDFVANVFYKGFAIPYVEKLLTPLEKAYFHNNNANIREKLYYSFGYESIWTLAWSLGFVEWSEPLKMCKSRELEDKIRSYSSIKDMLFHANPRSEQEILEKAALIADHVKTIEGMKENNAEYTIVAMTRHRVFTWLIRSCKMEWDDMSGYMDKYFDEN